MSALLNNLPGDSRLEEEPALQNKLMTSLRLACDSLTDKVVVEIAVY